jgi:hypothetical protein
MLEVILTSVQFAIVTINVHYATLRSDKKIILLQNTNDGNQNFYSEINLRVEFSVI